MRDLVFRSELPNRGSRCHEHHRIDRRPAAATQSYFEVQVLAAELHRRTINASGRQDSDGGPDGTPPADQ